MADLNRFINIPKPLANPTNQLKGLVLGYFQEKADKKEEKSDIPKKPLLLSTTERLNEKLNNLIDSCLSNSLASGKFGEVRIVYPNDKDLPGQLALVGLGDIENDKHAPWKVRDNFRRAAALGVKTLKAQGVKCVLVDPMLHPQAVAEGSKLATYSCDQLKQSAKKNEVDVQPYGEGIAASTIEEWKRGVAYAQAQNIARLLAEAPANLCNPTAFCDKAKELFKEFKNAEVIVHEQEFCKQKGMNVMLSVTQGSEQPMKLLEIRYNWHLPGQPLGLVGKGICFDSGGISIKPAAGMTAMKADMTGAACVVSGLYGIASLNIPTKIVAVVPLCENLPSGRATKPGDVFVAMNGKSVEVDNTDAEGRLVLADALCYIQEHNPAKIVDLATLTGAMAIALGHPACGVFSNSDSLFQELESAGLVVGERMWRMPLWDEYKESLDSTVADLKNVGARYGGSCAAAAFLKEFVETDKVEWAHMDIAGTMDESPHSEIYKKGMMTGRPTRLLIELAQSYSQ